MWYCILYIAWVLSLNLIFTHYTTSGLPIHHQTEVWWFSSRLKINGEWDDYWNKRFEENLSQNFRC